MSILKYKIYKEENNICPLILPPIQISQLNAIYIYIYISSKKNTAHEYCDNIYFIL